VLKQRVITAVVLVAALLAALAWSPFALLALVTLALALAQAEWLQLAGWNFRSAMVLAPIIGVLLLGVLLYVPQWIDAAGVPILSAATCAWLVIGVLLLRFGQHPLRVSTGVSVTLAFLLPLAAWCALVLFLNSGAILLLSVLVIVWLADIAAYFAGRAFGKRKLAPHISPGKTWAGFWGAIVAVIAVSLLTWLLAPGAELFSSRLIDRLGIALALPLLAVLVAVSVVGDLFESLLKRQAGAKDSGHLLPGHGGFFDRIDAMLALLPPAALLWRWVQ